jgi:hypothetical protein
MRLSGGKRGLWYDFERGEGGDVLDLIARKHGIRVGEAIRIAEREYLGGPEMQLAAGGRPPCTLPAVPNAAKDRIKVALRIWGETGPLTGTLGECYFVAHRTLDVRLLDLDALRWHAQSRAVVALMTDPITSEPVGIHRTFLDADGAKAERKMLGRQGVVRLSPNEQVTTGLGISEGVEDGISILLLGWSPVWAATSAGALARFPVLAGIEALTLFSDADEPGIQAAGTCAKRWCTAGREACLVNGKGVSHGR